MRLVATDLDGTLLAPDGSVSARTRAVLHRCVDGGIPVVFVTGRPLRWMDPICAATGLDGTAVISNGAAVADLRLRRVIRSHAFTQSALAETIAALRAALPGARFGLETGEGPLWEIGYPAREVLDEAPPRLSLPDLLAQAPPVFKILCRVPAAASVAYNVDDMLARARTALTGLAEAVHSNPRDHLLEISAQGVTKGAALAAYAHELGISASDVVAFGDMPNDASMLSWAGQSYAMADGHREAIAAATAIAPSATHDGVAQILEGLLDDAG